MYKDRGLGDGTMAMDHGEYVLEWNLANFSTSFFSYAIQNPINGIFKHRREVVIFQEQIAKINYILTIKYKLTNTRTQYERYEHITHFSESLTLNYKERGHFAGIYTE